MICTYFQKSAYVRTHVHTLKDSYTHASGTLGTPDTPGTQGTPGTPPGTPDAPSLEVLLVCLVVCLRNGVSDDVRGAPDGVHDGVPCAHVVPGGRGTYVGIQFGLVCLVCMCAWCAWCADSHTIRHVRTYVHIRTIRHTRHSIMHTVRQTKQGTQSSTLSGTPSGMPSGTPGTLLSTPRTPSGTTWATLTFERIN
jgi:hypothetical protein